ncbi:MFS general substrate transporter [Pleurotus eryngii]|uniref:MFS general substrate transporter n=1 Tax=Pleurotus eryngii TaxID=5323 RepID=A0A9P5ZR21_PLEER|nr:MFS general substrate transporter [Pleurotus eryngii]
MLTNDSPPVKEKPSSSSPSSSSIVINGRSELPRPDADTTDTEARGHSEIAIHSDIEGALYASLSPRCKLVLLGVFCSAQFFDVFNASAVLVSLPSLGADLHFAPGALQWILSAYTLTFASFMLVAGTLADIFHPKPIFCLGFAFVGVFNIPVGASVHPVMAIVFRALQGMGAAMNVPSGIAMIRTTFPDPVEHSAAYTSYALAATVGNISGFVVGGVLTARTSWHWVHYLCAIMVIPMSVAAWFLLPAHTTPLKSEQRSVDIPGILTLTAGLILFVYAISDAVDAGWASPQVITTLILSIIAFVAFFAIESVVAHPALPPQTWRNKNFTPLFFYVLCPYWWCLGCKLQLVTVFLNLWHDSPLVAALRCLPIGVAGGVASYFVGRVLPYLPAKWVLVAVQLLTATGSMLFALAGTEERYWSFVFPRMVVGMLGLASVYVECTTMVMGDAQKGEEGVVGAVMYTAYQVGSTISIAILTLITEGVNSRQPNDQISQFKGYAASFWSMLALSGVMFGIVLVFVQR